MSNEENNTNIDETQETEQHDPQETKSENTPQKEDSHEKDYHEVKSVGKGHSSAPKQKTKISERLDEAVKEMKAINRSSDLVPLNHQYDVLRKRLRALIVKAKEFHATKILLTQNRTEMVKQFSLMAKGSPIDEKIGSTESQDSFATVDHAIETRVQSDMQKFQRNIIDYALEWEDIVTTRVDSDLKDTTKLNERLNHYQNKVEGIRKKVNAKESKLVSRGKDPSATPTKLNQKLERNEAKLNHAWKAHEASASKLCNLMEEATQRGWKDLFPLVKAAIDWQAETASGEYDIFARLPSVATELADLFEEKNQASEKNSSGVPLATDDDGSGDSDTTGSAPHDDTSFSGSEISNGGNYADSGSPTVGGHKGSESPRHVDLTC
jgi:hypothetical protein